MIPQLLKKNKFFAAAVHSDIFGPSVYQFVVVCLLWSHQDVLLEDQQLSPLGLGEAKLRVGYSGTKHVQDNLFVAPALVTLDHTLLDVLDVSEEGIIFIEFWTDLAIWRQQEGISLFVVRIDEEESFTQSETSYLQDIYESFELLISSTVMTDKMLKLRSP